MAIAVVIQWTEGFDQAKYQEISEVMGYTSSLPKGCEDHIAGGDVTGFFVSEVWDSPELFNTFTEHELRPASQNAGIPAPTSVTVYPLVRQLSH
jgi:hypothetical protein